MVQEQTTQPPAPRGPVMRGHYPYDEWMESVGLPIYRGHFVSDPAHLELADWPERGVHAAFVQLVGMQGVCESRITEIAAGRSSVPCKLAVGEVIYVLEGEGLCTVWAGDGPRQTFEWQKHSLFLLPRNCWHQFSNARGDRPARLLNYNHLPLAMSTVPDVDFQFGGPLEEPERLYGQEEFYGEAVMITKPGAGNLPGQDVYWRANFIPNMNSWDELVPHHGRYLKDRGASGSVVRIEFSGGDMDCHMSVFDPQLYTKAHKHGPGRVIVITKGEGYSVLWPGPGVEGERVVCPWQQGSIFVPPDNWYHQHFNTGRDSARYLALHTLPQFSGNPYRHQIEYTNEDPWIRERFESEIAKQGLKSLMPNEAYENADWEWDYGDEK
jgi:quercetin dioxygenase-like cupin family protein